MRLTRHRDCSGKGTPRRKVKKVHKSAGTDDKKLQTSLKKLNVQPIQAIEEVNMFKSDGNVIHFSAPKGGFSLPSHYLFLCHIHAEFELPLRNLYFSWGWECVDGHDMTPLARPSGLVRSASRPESLLNYLLTAISPIVHASVPANTFAIYGAGEDKELTELVPGILNQLGPDSLASLRKLAESYQSMQKEKGEDDKKEDEDDDDIPDLVAGENFESKGDVE